MITKFGNWIFHYRNFLFIFLYAGVFIPSSKVLNSSISAIIAGLLFIFSGMAIRGITIGLEYIERGGLKRKINANNLVTGGIYSICRNPMYLGNMLILFGFGIYANSGFFTFVIFPLFVFIYYSIIKAEEQFLTQKFGKEYERYKQEVNAILPAVFRLNTAFRNHKFNWGKMIFKEYNSTFIYFSGILIISFFQQTLNVFFIVICLILLDVTYLIIKIMKYKKRAKMKLDLSNI